jgi:hypothetical protein
MRHATGRNQPFHLMHMLLPAVNTRFDMLGYVLFSEGSPYFTFLKQLTKVGHGSVANTMVYNHEAGLWSAWILDGDDK